jgi:hypothetical protein
MVVIGTKADMGLPRRRFTPGAIDPLQTLAKFIVPKVSSDRQNQERCRAATRPALFIPEFSSIEHAIDR